MLYDTWLAVARERGAETALWEVESGRRWSFAELCRVAEAEAIPGTGMVHPQGHSARFVVEVLRGWRSGRVVCPLEPGQQPPAVPGPPGSCRHLKMTSATTGSPKVIAFTECQLAADAANIVATMGLRPDWPNLGAISMAHSYGFSNLVLPLLLHGIPLIIAASPLPEMLKVAAAGHPHLTLAGVPALWRAWLAAGVIPGTVRLAISAGAPLGIGLEGSIHERTGLKVHNFYGCSECGGIAYDATPMPREREEHVGQAMRNVRLETGPEGCLSVISRAAGECYWPDLSPALGDGRFVSADLAEIIGGEVHLRGRLGEQINVAGRKVSPEVVEAAIRSHPEVRECVVFGVPSGSEDRVDQIVACVAGVAGSGVADLRRHLLDILPAWQVPRDFWIVESLAANGRGKLSRPEWRRNYLSRNGGV